MCIDANVHFKVMVSFILLASKATIHLNNFGVTNFKQYNDLQKKECNLMQQTLLM